MSADVGSEHNLRRTMRRLDRAGRFLWSRRIRGKLTGLLAGLIIAASLGPGAGTAQEATPAWEPGATPESLVLGMAIDQLIPEDGGVFGAMVIDPDRNVVYGRNPTVPFISASLYKLPLMAHIYALIEQGALQPTGEIFLQTAFWSEGPDSYYDWSWTGLSTTVEEALFAAGAYSSNVAAWALSTLITWPEVEATARAIGMADTHMYVSPSTLPIWPPDPGPGDSPEDLTTAVALIESFGGWGPVMLTTPRDIAAFFSGLLAGRVVSVQASWAMLDILAQQAVTDRFPLFLPEQTWIAHKTGNLPGILHDAGIIYTGSGPVILVGMSQAATDEWVAISALQQLALTVYQAYQA